MPIMLSHILRRDARNKLGDAGLAPEEPTFFAIKRTCGRAIATVESRRVVTTTYVTTMYS